MKNIFVIFGYFTHDSLLCNSLPSSLIPTPHQRFVAIFLFPPTSLSFSHILVLFLFSKFIHTLFASIPSISRFHVESRNHLSIYIFIHLFIYISMYMFITINLHLTRTCNRDYHSLGSMCVPFSLLRLPLLRSTLSLCLCVCLYVCTCVSRFFNCFLKSSMTSRRTNW